MMRIRLISLMSAVVMLLTLVVGCAGSGTATPSGGKDDAVQKKAQLTVAMNPIFVYDDGEAVIAYNDIKNAMKTDYEGASLTAMYNNTGWMWIHCREEGWARRAVYGLSCWHNGAGVTAKKTNAYAFNADSSISVMTYSAMSLELATYDGTAVPEYGLLLSVSGKEQEGLYYTVPKDGILNIPAGTVAAVEAVAGVSTGFLAEDGTRRQAAVSITVNSLTVWSGTLCNSTAGDGAAVTTLNYPQITDIPVTAGDHVIISVQLDAEANRVEDITAPEEEQPNNSTVSDTPSGGSNVDVDNTPNTSEGTENSQPQEAEETIPLIENYEAKFTLVHAGGVETAVKEVAETMRTRMEQTLDTMVFLRNEEQGMLDYEIVIGKVESRPESVKMYNDLIDSRVNNADDYIIRRVGTRIYIVATNPTTLQKAVDDFLTSYCPDDDAQIPAALNKVCREEKKTVLIGNANAATYTIRLERYPSVLLVEAAEDLRDHILAQTGYMLQIVRGGTATGCDIQVGPQNNGVRVVWNSDETRITGVQDSGYSGDYAAYQATVEGSTLCIGGGSSYAVNAGVQALCAALEKTSTLPAGYTLSGSYEDGSYTLSGNYGLSWADEFDYDEGSDAANEKAVKRRWYISRDTGTGPTVIGYNSKGEPMWDEQRRNGIYGDTWWIEDGMLWEITKWAPYGYDSVRLTTQNKMFFRYGMLDVRMVLGTRNGACSSVWMASDELNHVLGPEIDVYENFGRDSLIHAALTWTTEEYGGDRSHFGRGTGNETWTSPEEGEHYYDTFHHIGLRWTADVLEYYIDGTLTYAHDVSEAEYDSLDNTIVLKLANGVGTRLYADGTNPWDHIEDVTQFYETQLVDYARIYQLDEEGYTLRTR